MGETQITEVYFAKEDIYDEAGYRTLPIPKGVQVQFLEEYTNFYGRYVKVIFGGTVYYTKPEYLTKNVIRKRRLDKAVPEANAHHEAYGDVVMIAELVVKQTGVEFWCVKDKNSVIHVVDIKDCTDFHIVDYNVEEPVTYRG